jgi:hypothetical protein
MPIIHMDLSLLPLPSPLYEQRLIITAHVFLKLQNQQISGPLIIGLQ